MKSVSDMPTLSQIVGETATPICHSLCVVEDLSPWHPVGVSDSSDKNGGPNNLQAWRLYRGLTQEALAKEVGTSANMIQYLETGERGLSLKWLRRLAPALKTTSGHLADHAPDDVDMEAHDLFAQPMTPDQRRQLVAVAAAILKTGTGGK